MEVANIDSKTTRTGMSQSIAQQKSAGASIQP